VLFRSDSCVPVLNCLPPSASSLRRRQLNLSRKFSATELEHVMAYSDGRDGLLADIHIVSLVVELPMLCEHLAGAEGIAAWLPCDSMPARYGPS